MTQNANDTPRDERDDVAGFQLQWTLVWHSPVGTDRVQQRNDLFPSPSPAGRAPARTAAARRSASASNARRRIMRRIEYRTERPPVAARRIRRAERPADDSRGFLAGSVTLVSLVSIVRRPNTDQVEASETGTTAIATRG